MAALLGRRIVRGELSPGDTLPTEAELCDAFHVSRTTVREALKRLHGKGLVAGNTRSGTRVLPAGRWNQFDSDLLTWCLEAGDDRDLLRELFEIRMCFEPEACRVASLRATPDDHKRIGRTVDRMASVRASSAEVLDADIAFHMAIVDATHNRFFVTLGQAVMTAHGVSFAQRQGRAGLPADELTMRSEIAAAIVAGKADDAAATMRDLVVLARNAVETRFAATPHRP